MPLVPVLLVVGTSTLLPTTINKFKGLKLNDIPFLTLSLCASPTIVRGDYWSRNMTIKVEYVLIAASVLL